MLCFFNSHIMKNLMYLFSESNVPLHYDLTLQSAAKGTAASPRLVTTAQVSKQHLQDPTKASLSTES